MKKNYFLCLALTLMFSSCISKKYIDIQVLKPAKVQLPVMKELIVQDDRNDRSYHFSYQKQFFNLISLNFYQSFKENLQKSPAFENTSIEFLTPEKVKDYPETSDSNVYLLNCRLKVKIDTAYARGVYGAYVNYYKFQFNLTNLKDSTLVDWFQLSDISVYRKNSAKDDGSEGLSELAKKCGAIYALRVAPSWSAEERMLYHAGNRIMRKGYKSFVENNLDEAMIQWRKLAVTGNRHLASVAAFNVALVYEMMDDLENSEIWLTKSAEYKKTEETTKYLDVIRKRKLARISLEKQFSID